MLFIFTRRPWGRAPSVGFEQRRAPPPRPSGRAAGRALLGDAARIAARNARTLHARDAARTSLGKGAESPRPAHPRDAPRPSLRASAGCETVSDRGILAGTWAGLLQPRPPSAYQCSSPRWQLRERAPRSPAPEVGTPMSAVTTPLHSPAGSAPRAPARADLMLL